MQGEQLPLGVQVFFAFAMGAWCIYASRVAYRDPNRARKSYWFRPRWSSRSDHIFRLQAIAGVWFGCVLLVCATLLLFSTRPPVVVIVAVVLALIATPFLLPGGPATLGHLKHHANVKE